MTIPVCDHTDNYYNMVSPCYNSDYSQQTCRLTSAKAKSPSMATMQPRVSFSEQVATNLYKPLSRSYAELNNEVSFFQLGFKYVYYQG